MTFRRIPDAPKQIKRDHLTDDGWLKGVNEYHPEFEDAAPGQGIPIDNQPVELIKLLDESNQEHRFAIYTDPDKESILGEGGYGEVRLMQDLETGHWHAVKINELQTAKDKPKDEEVTALYTTRENLFKQEATHLRDVKKTDSTALITTALRKHTGEKTPQYIIGMAVEPGVQMKEFIGKKHHTMPTIRWLQLARSATEQLALIHKSGKLHRDIKPQNMQVLTTGEVRILDFGFAVDSEDKNTVSVKDSRIVGTSIYRAPELLKTREENILIAKENHRIDTSEHKNFNDYEYNEKTEVYALGCSLYEMLGFADRDSDIEKEKVDGHSVRKEFSFKGKPALERLPDSATRNLVQQFIALMVDKDPQKRPALEEARQFFDYLEKDILQATDRFMRIGVLDVTEYSQLTKSEKDEYFQAIYAMDKIILVGNDQLLDKDLKNLIDIKNQLESKGIQVHSEMLTLAHEQPLSVKTLADKDIFPEIEKVYDGKIASYFIISKKEPAKDDSNHHLIHHLQINEYDSYYNHLYKIDRCLHQSLLPKQKIGIIIKSLNRQINNVANSDNFKDQEKEARIEKISQAIRYIDSKQGTGLTIKDITKRLDQLQKELPSHHRAKRFLNAITFGAFGKSATAEAVEAIKYKAKELGELTEPPSPKM